MAPSIRLQAFAEGNGPAVARLVLKIQQQEFSIPIRLEDQPDLLDIPKHYRQGFGDFWVAETGGEIIGTIGLIDVGGGLGVIRKMFVASPYRGRQHGVAQALLDTLVVQARNSGCKELLLGTITTFEAACRFYERNGFERIEAALLPARFPRMSVDNAFYRKALA